MAPQPSRFVRDNAFILAAVALPVLVAAFFLIASAIPQWTVADPTYDLVLRVPRPYDTGQTKVTVDFEVRDGLVEAVLRPVPEHVYGQLWALLYFDHDAMSVRELPLDLPASLPNGEERRTIAIDALQNVRVSPQLTAPDGYALETSTSGGPGLVGDLFGIGRYRARAVLVNRGRMVRLELPAPYEQPYSATAYTVGWVLDRGTR